MKFLADHGQRVQLEAQPQKFISEIFHEQEFGQNAK